MFNCAARFFLKNAATQMRMCKHRHEFEQQCGNALKIFCEFWPQLRDRFGMQSTLVSPFSDNDSLRLAVFKWNCVVATLTGNSHVTWDCYGGRERSANVCDALADMVEDDKCQTHHKLLV